jgi:hypothetical protein
LYLTGGRVETDGDDTHEIHGIGSGMFRMRD